MGGEILCPSGNIYWGDHTAFCTHHLKQHRAGQRPQAFMDEIATMIFFLSQDYLVSELQMEACNGGEAEEGPPEEVSHLWIIYKLLMNSPPLSCTHIDWATACLSQHAPFNCFQLSWGDKSFTCLFSLRRTSFLSPHYRGCCFWVPQTNNPKQINGIADSSLTCLNVPWRWKHRLGVFRNALPHWK